MMNKTKNSQKHLLKFLFVLPVIVLIMVAFRNTNSETKNVNATLSADTEQAFTLSELTYSISDPLVAMIIKKEQDKSILQVGKPFNISIIRNERDRLKSLLERNGYTNIGNHSISFLIDSSLTNNSFSVQVNIDLRTRSSSLGTSKEVRQNKKSNAAIDQNDNKHVSMGSSLNVFTKSVEHFAMEEFDNNNMNTENSSVI